MSVKSTVHLTRAQAEERYASLKAESKKRKYRSQAVALTNTDLEDRLEELNDLVHDGEGYENYLIYTS